MFSFISISINVIIHEAVLKDRSCKRVEGFGLLSYLALEAVKEAIQLLKYILTFNILNYILITY